MTKKLNILISASEVVPFAKTGGLADVAGSIAKELKNMGHDVRVVMPRYYKIDKTKYNLQPIGEPLGVPMGIIGEMWCAVLEGKIPGTDVPVYFIEHEDYYGKEGLYNDDHGEGFIDNDNRFVFLSKASLQLCKMLDFKPDIIQVNDWQTAVVPVFLNTIYKDDPLFKETASLLTIHNMRHQGEFYEGLMDVLGIGWEHFTFLGLEKDNKTNLLKGGIYHSTLVNTVSKGYVKEIHTPEHGYGLEGVIQNRTNDVYGIINGIDYTIWNPETDKYIAANYSEHDLSGKKVCKRDLQREFGLPEKDDVPVIGIVTRLDSQKGIDILAEAIYGLLGYDLQLVLLGTGESWAHFYFGEVASKVPNKFGCKIAYDNTIAHKIEAGCDFFLMPSRFEPCGLNQMYSLRYGTIPIVRATGGLEDTIENFNEETGEGTGFKFYDLTSSALYNTVGWAIYNYYHRKALMEKLVIRAMQQRFTMEEAAKKYEQLFYKAIETKTGKKLVTV